MKYIPMILVLPRLCAIYIYWYSVGLCVFSQVLVPEPNIYSLYGNTSIYTHVCYFRLPSPIIPNQPIPLCCVELWRIKQNID